MIDIENMNYYRELSIFNHLHELIALKNAQVVAKSNITNNEQVKRLNDKIDDEMMDLHLLLLKWADTKNTALIVKRRASFRDKVASGINPLID